MWYPLFIWRVGVTVKVVASYDPIDPIRVPYEWETIDLTNYVGTWDSRGTVTPTGNDPVYYAYWIDIGDSSTAYQANVDSMFVIHATWVQLTSGGPWVSIGAVDNYSDNDIYGVISVFSVTDTTEKTAGNGFTFSGGGFG